MKDVERKLMTIEARLDRIQNEVRKALGEVREALEYHNPHRQKTLRHYGFGETWRHSVRRGRERVEKRVT